jgi:hypothetical protein
MATKKSEQSETIKQSTQLATDWKFILKWLFILGGLTAGVTNALSIQPDYLIWGLMFVGIVVGVFYFNSDDLINIGLRYLIFGAVANAIGGGFGDIGAYLGAFFLGFFYYLGPLVLTVIVVYFVKKYILSK